MAISEPHYRAIRELRLRGELHQGGSILEIGEANYYGDMPPSEIESDIDGMADRESPGFMRAYANMLAAEHDEPEKLFAIAKVIYHIFWKPSKIVSIDANGTDAALHLDLNRNIRLASDGVPCLFETVINHGTAEHVFHIANVFKIMHDHCAVGGLMIHESPFTGWVDHGFYTLQPTLFYDVAAANAYDIRYLAIEQIESKLLQRVGSREEIHELAAAGKLPNNAMLYVAMRKTADVEFKIPMQGIYSDALSESARESWRELR